MFMFCVYLLSFQGIPRPLPINKSRINRDSSFISDDDDVTRESFNVSKSIEDTEEFRKAVESFDKMFGGETRGSQTPDVKRISVMESRKNSETPASPNLNWKRIKTSRSFEMEETFQHQESFSSSRMETREESMTAKVFQSEQTRMEERQSHVVHEHEQHTAHSEQRQEIHHSQEQSISQTVKHESSSSSEKKKSKKSSKKSKERVRDNEEQPENASDTREKKKSKRKNKQEAAEREDASDPGPLEDPEEREHKISLIGEHYQGAEGLANERPVSRSRDHSRPITGHEQESVIDPESIKNVDGPARQRKGGSRFSRKQKSPSRSNRSSGNDLDNEDPGVADMSPEDVSRQEGAS